jgi:homoserine kinase
MSRSVRIRVPATTANLGPGFDCLGLALKLYNHVTVRTDGEAYLTIHVSGSARTPQIACDSHNLVYRAFRRVFETAGVPLPNLIMDLEVNTPLARGLGSSASAIVGGMTAANALLPDPLPEQQLIREMVRMEGHPDNVMACYAGGLVASLLADDRVIYEKHVPAPNIRCVLVVPGYELATSRARQAIPRRIPLADAVFNMARVPHVITRLCSGRLENLAILMDDRLHQPYRQPLVKGFDVIASEAERAGAAAVCLSGAGPTMLAICEQEQAAMLTQRLAEATSAIGVPAQVLATAPDNTGAVVEPEN